jgi:hypothetical protein
MATLTIDSENNIAVRAGSPANADNLGMFASEKELAKLSADWQATRLVEVWNSFAGVTPFDDLKSVRKFTGRKAAVARIWTAVQRLSADAAPQARDVAPAVDEVLVQGRAAPPRRKPRMDRAATRRRSSL